LALAFSRTSFTTSTLAVIPAAFADFFFVAIGWPLPQ
jgi:hypothetical protein